MSKTVIYNLNTKYVYATYDTEQGARSAYSRAMRRLTAGKRAKVGSKHMTLDKLRGAAVCSAEVFRTQIDQLVTVRSLQTGAEVQLRESEVGGPCDPSTERYWCM